MKTTEKYDLNKHLPVFIIFQTYKNWRNDRTLRLGAGIAYYGVFAIIPIFTLMLGLAAYVYSTQDVKNFVNDFLLRILGNGVVDSINQIVESLFSKNLEGAITGTSVIGVVGLIITASFIFVAFQDAMDSIWGNDIRLGLKAWIKRYIWAYIVVLLSSTLLVAIFLVNSVGTFLASIFPGQLVFVEFLENIAVTSAIWVVGILVLSVIYKMLIYKKLSWKIVIFGSAITSVLVFVGTWALGIYIRLYGGSSISGALGAVLLLLVWVYYEAQIALIGAQFIKTLNENKKKLPSIFK